MILPKMDILSNLEELPDTVEQPLTEGARLFNYISAHWGRVNTMSGIIPVRLNISSATEPHDRFNTVTIAISAPFRNDNYKKDERNASLCQWRRA